MSSSKVQMITPDILLDDGKVMRNVLLFNPDIKEWDSMVAYLHGDYFYIYRGKLPEDKKVNEPGIYLDRQTNTPILVEPSTEEDKAYYTYNDKICSTTTNDIINKINNKEVEVFIMPESSKAFCPEITEADDILKRLMKKAIIEKGIDLDRFKARFVDKNALFNFKQVLKGDNRLSMLLFDRGVEAFNLKYTIILSEAEENNHIGARLAEPIIMTSEDTHPLNGNTMKLEEIKDA